MNFFDLGDKSEERKNLVPLIAAVSVLAAVIAAVVTVCLILRGKRLKAEELGDCECCEELRPTDEPEEETEEPAAAEAETAEVDEEKPEE